MTPELLRAAVAAIKRIATLRDPPYELPGDGQLERIALDIFTLCFELEGGVSLQDWAELFMARAEQSEAETKRLREENAALKDELERLQRNCTYYFDEAVRTGNDAWQYEQAYGRLCAAWAAEKDMRREERRGLLRFLAEARQEAARWEIAAQDLRDQLVQAQGIRTDQPLTILQQVSRALADAGIPANIDAAPGMTIRYGLVDRVEQLAQQAASYLQRAEVAEERNRQAICTYCGWEGPKLDITGHILKCPKHPMGLDRDPQSVGLMYMALRSYVGKLEAILDAVQALQEANKLMEGPRWARAFDPALREVVTMQLPTRQPPWPALSSSTASETDEGSGP